MKGLMLTIAVCGALLFGGCGEGGHDSSADSSQASNSSVAKEQQPPPVDRVTKAEGPPPSVKIPPGGMPRKLKIIDLKKGAGVAAKRGDELTVQFSSVYGTSGRRYESSWIYGRTFTFTLDSKSVSPGWVRGLPGMKVGGRRKLLVPSYLTSRYGAPSSTGARVSLVYVVDLLEARPPGAVGPPSTTERAKPRVEVPKGPPPRKLVVRDIEKGSGPPAADGDELTVNYVALLTTGKPISPGSWGYGESRTFTLGAGKELLGWELGLKGMRAGGRRKLLVPSQLSTPYGASAGAGVALAYVVDLLEIKSP